MPVVSKSVLKGYFNNGDVPNESNYVDLIDTMGDMSLAAYDTDLDGKVNSAESADVAPWTGISGKPSTFPPSAHNQDWTTITGKPATYPPSAHNQDWTTILNPPGTYPPSAHLHDSDYHRKDVAVVNSFDARFGGGLYVGSTATDPPTGYVYATQGMRTSGGLRLGDLTGAPAAGQLSMTGQVIASLASGVSARISANQALTNGAYTIIALNAELFDNDDMWTSPNNYLVNPLAGVYVIVANVEFAANATGARGLNITVNNVIVGSILVNAAAGGTLSTVLQVTAISNLSANAQIRMTAFQNAGTLNAISANSLTRLSMVRIA